jgi:L-ascorbate metabolism protein UlaG (beta-lactamase superfamily)
MKIIDLINQPIIDNSLKIGYLGQSGYVLKKNNFTILIDPYLSNYFEDSNGLNDKKMKRNFPPPVNPTKINCVDLVLCTHGHYDHMDPWTLEKIKPNFKLYCSETAYNNNKVSLNNDQLKFIDLNEIINLGEFQITPLPAAHYHKEDINGRLDCLSFFITIGDLKLFFWGDGILYDGLLENLSKHHFNMFFAPINGRDWFREKEGIIGNISSRELAQICSNLNIDCVVPNHFDLFDYNSEIPSHFINYLQKFSPNQKVQIMQKSEIVIL